MRLLALTGVVLIALVGAGSAQADHRTDNLVLDGSGDLTASAKGVLRGGMFLPIQGYSSWFLTQATTINGVLVPAGTQLTTAQATTVMAQSGGLAAVAQNASVSGAPSGAISPARQTAATSVIERARRAGRVLPGVRTVGTYALVATATALPTYAQALQMELPGQGFIYQLWSGAEYYSATQMVNARWQCVGTKTDGSNCEALSVAPLLGGWRFRSNGSDAVYWTTAPGAIDSYTDGPPSTGACAAGSAEQNEFCAAALTFGTTARWYLINDTPPQYSIRRTDDQMNVKVNTDPADGDTYNNWDSGRRTSYTYNQPTYTSGDDDAMTAPIAEGTEAANDAEDAIAKAIDPATDNGLDPATGLPNPVQIVPPATTIPATPAVDFSPVTGLDPGCKFPYGFVCYAVDFTEQFNVSGDAPRFEFTLGFMGSAGVPSVGEAEYVVDLEVMDDYMALWRGILTVVLWVGAIYLVATRMLGVKFGGDPGEAMDDVL